MESETRHCNDFQQRRKVSSAETEHAIMQTTATGQDSKQATATDVPRETTLASTKLGFTRRSFFSVAAATVSVGLLDVRGFCRRDKDMTDGIAEIAQETGRKKSDIRPFHVNVPEAELTELRRRINSTRWPDRETVTDESQGVPLATIQELARYWATDYDWRKCEAKLNALPQFITEIDGLDIHFIHVRSKHENALPLIVTHGWPGSVIEQLKIIDPLTNPTAHGGSASDAFHLVIPSLPGFGFSARPTTTGWGPERTASAWVVLMKRLGYAQFVSQGGDLGAGVCTVMAKHAPPELLGIHTNFPGTIPSDIARALQCGDPPPSGLSADERRAYEQLQSYLRRNVPTHK